MHDKTNLHLLIKGYRKYKIQIFILVFLGFISGFMEGIGITTLVPLFAKLTGSGVVEDPISKAIGVFISWFGLGFELKALLPFMIITFSLKSLFVILSQYIYTRVSETYACDTRSNLMREMLAARWPFLVRQKLGTLETMLLVDVDTARALFLTISQMVVFLASILVYIAIAFSISSMVTTTSLVLGGIVFLLIKPLLYRTKELSKSAAYAYSNMAHHTSENIIGIKTVKASGVEEFILKKADTFFDLLKTVSVKIRLLGVISSAIPEPISIIFITVVFALSFMSGNFAIGTFAATMYLIHKIFRHIQYIQQFLYLVNERVPYLARIIQFQEDLGAAKEVRQGKEPFRFQRHLEFGNVCFSYEPSRVVLNDLRFQIAKGEMVGLVGKSGSGKTTIVDLILRLIGPSSGQILIDKIPIENISLAEWRREIGYVSQEIFVMNDTIEQNIRFYNTTLLENEIKAAAKIAQIYDFIQNAPKRFQTQVGERGLLLSGGEKQRLVLARVLARKPEILILDEATSALDNESELKIQQAIEGLKGKTTIFVIAHRLSTLLNCDRILFLENGRIVEEGSPALLLSNRDSQFFRLYNIRDNL